MCVVFFLLLKFFRTVTDGSSSPPDSGFSVEHSHIHVAVFIPLLVLTVVIASLIISTALFNLMHAENKYVCP